MDTVLNAALAYFVIVDPIGASIIFNALTDGKDRTYCRTMAIRSVCLSATLVLVFGFWGAACCKVLAYRWHHSGLPAACLFFMPHSA